MREEPVEERLRSALLAGIWASSTVLLSWHASADLAIGDSGEIGGAAFSLGVAHETGFPLDMLLLRAFALLPIGSIAWRENVGVACVAAGAVTCVARLSAWLAEQVGISLAGGAAFAALVAGGALLGFQTFLASALAVEVYSTALLLVSCAALTLALTRHSRKAALYPLFGLALGAHVTAGLLMLPLLAADAISGWRRRIAAPRWLVARGTPIALAALLIAYLPLASRRDLAFDWGDPETPVALWRHLSAARIREAYASDMFANQGAPSAVLFAQLAQHSWLLLLALLGLVVLWRARRPIALLSLALLSLDLGYAVWVNPMGIAERQLGHASGALLAVLGGLGGACSIHALAARLRPRAFALSRVSLALALLLLFQIEWPQRADGYAVSERYGAGSPLLDLAPRSVYVCATDSACASALFAVYAEGARPDCVVVPAQHLWDETVTRRLVGLVSTSHAPLPATARRAQADRTLREVLRSSRLRPVYVEIPQATALDPAAIASGFEHVPWIGVSAQPFDPGLAERATRQLAAIERARFGAAGPPTALSRGLWASAHAEFGKVCLASDALAAGTAALRRAVELTPERAVAHSNLGVALEKQGDLSAALTETRRALELEPARPTAWVNLARLMLRTTGREAALSVLNAADRNAVRDPRLNALRAALLASRQ
jgi:tetratricopeptide (TPR) repeat protein